MCRAAVVVVSLGLLFCSARDARADDLSALAATLRPVILSNMPHPLYEKVDNWGHQSMSFSRIKWRGLRPRVIETLHNDGTWRKMRITARNPHSTLEIKLSGLKPTGRDRQTFQAYLAMMVTVHFDQQVWESGVRLYSGDVRARVLIKAALDCENTIRFEYKNKKDLLPETTIFRLRVLKANVGYDDLVVEHIAGIGGTGAKLIGEAVHGAIKEFKPSLERELIAKANAAIVKVADTREVRISLGKVFDKFSKK